MWVAENKLLNLSPMPSRVCTERKLKSGAEIWNQIQVLQYKMWASELPTKPQCCYFKNWVLSQGIKKKTLAIVRRRHGICLHINFLHRYMVPFFFFFLEKRGNLPVLVIQDAGCTNDGALLASVSYTHWQQARK